MARTAGGVVEFTMKAHESSTGQAIENVLHIHIDQTGSLSDRHDAIVDQVGILQTHWQDDMIGWIASSYVYDGVEWVDLDTADGEVGFAPYLTGHDHIGGAGTPPATAQVCFLIKKTINVRGRRGGRIYHGICGEATVDDAGNISGLSGLQGHVDDFVAAVEQNAGVIPPNYDSNFVVVHWPTEVVYVEVNGVTYPRRRIPDDAVGVVTDVDAHVLEARCATQRRRLKRS